jgi:dienelactone hydrolase
VKPVPLIVLTVALAMAAGAYVVRRTMARGPRAVAESEAPPPSREAPADWCTTGYEPIPGGCLAVPTSSPHPALLIYLHGRYAKDQSAEETDRQRRVAERFTSKGYAVLALRGKLGGCGSAELSSWYCWPSNERTVGTAGDVVESWQGVLDETDDRVQPERRFVLGFSNGGYFATLLAARGLVQADAYVIAHAGPAEPVVAAKGTPPLLLLSADDDIAQDDMLRLDAELARAHWAHDSYARAGAHGLTDQDIDAALAFFARFKEPLPLDPPIAGLHRPSHHEHDTGAPASVSSGEEMTAPTSVRSDSEASPAAEETTPPAAPASAE